MTPEQRKAIPKRNYRSNYNLVGEKFGLLTVTGLSPKRYLTPQGKPRRQWLCLCECGTETIVQTNNLCMNRTVSCGCVRFTEEAIRKRAMGRVKSDAGIKETLRSYTKNAVKRGYIFSLSPKDAEQIFKSNCYYCDAEPANVYKKSYIPFRYNGIDRKDNSLGYTRENCVPCCKTCNIAKMNLGYDEFISMVKNIYENRIKNAQQSFN